MKRRFFSLVRLVGLLTLCCLPACGPLSRLNAVPQHHEDDITVLGGLHDARFWGDEVTPAMIADGIESYRRERAYATATGHPGPLSPASYLAISGGGENGAFGAGLLIGWTATGTRPEFKIVTGISTGALTAPFAFLGPAYDEQLREIYTKITPAEVLEKRWVVTGILSDAMATNEPLYKTIQRYLTPQVLAKIAEQHKRGRILLIGTTDLDAGRPVIWDIGRIAESGRPGALELVQKILLASAAIPVAFPPSMIDVEVDGHPYQEMNVDGGGSAQVFVYPPALQINRYGIARKRRLYVIRNARLDPQWANVTRRTLSIADRATSSLIQTQGIGDLYRIYSVSERDKVDFNLAYMPATFNVPLRYSFDPDYMNALFQVGFDLGKASYNWAKVPPGFGDINPHAGIPVEQSGMQPPNKKKAIK
jgi:predicted patatin/cPLA2 family phospholipase